MSKWFYAYQKKEVISAKSGVRPSLDGSPAKSFGDGETGLSFRGLRFFQGEEILKTVQRCIVHSLFIIVMILILTGCQSRQAITYQARLIKPPVATRQLGPAIFLPARVLKELQMEEGHSVLVTSDSAALELRAYLIMDSASVFAMQNEYRRKLKLSFGEQRLELKKLTVKEAQLSPRPLRVFAENYPGDLQKWPRIAYGAPHGDCDLETGQIVKLLTGTYGIPSTGGYGARLSYRGKWFDMNRPLMKLPKAGGGTWPDRIWNAQSEAVYRMYQDSVWRNSGLQYGERFELFCSFHGHDLSVRLKDGRKIERPVMEAMGVGFTKNELRKIKTFYEAHKKQYYAHPPLLVFGNLPEDRTYYYQGIPLTFFYSGLGTRVYGSLRSDLVKRALHIETPNTMRLQKEVQPQTAKFLYDLYEFVKDSLITIPTKSAKEAPVAQRPLHYGKMVPVPAGAFEMGTESKMAWSSERPAHRVNVSAFSIDPYEVTNEQFAAFLNKALTKKEIVLEEGTVKTAGESGVIVCRTVSAAPMSQIEYENQMFKALPGKEFFPVIFVSWYGAQMYAASQGKRLPTEAEWEKAASWDSRNNKKYLFAYGSGKVNEKKANFEDSGDPFEWGDQAFTSPVGWYHSKSPAGVWDMSGNVFEWCSDYYEYNFYKKENPDKGIDPQGPVKGTMRTVRGGAWNLEPWISRTTFRLGIHPKATLVNVGFRCVK